MSVPAGGSTAADNPPPEERSAAEVAWPEGTPASTAPSRCSRGSRTTAAHLSRVAARPDRRPPGPRADRRRASAPCRSRRAPDGPRLVWDEQPELPPGAVYLGEADGVPYAAVRGERALTVSGRPVDAWAGLREVGADLGDLDAGLLVQAIGILEWHERNRFSPLTGARDDDRARRLGAARPDHRHRVLPAHRPRRDHARPRRRRPRRARPAGGLAARPVLDPRRVRRAGGVGRGGGRPRGRRGGRAAGHRRPLRRQPAVAVPAVADARLRRPRRGRRHAAPRPRRDRGGPLVHPRRAARRRRARGRCRRRSRSPGTSSTAGWPASSTS